MSIQIKGSFKDRSARLMTGMKKARNRRTTVLSFDTISSSNYGLLAEDSPHSVNLVIHASYSSLLIYLLEFLIACSK